MKNYIRERVGVLGEDELCAPPQQTQKIHTRIHMCTHVHAHKYIHTYTTQHLSHMTNLHFNNDHTNLVADQACHEVKSGHRE